jgi:hypothetical protein
MKRCEDEVEINRIVLSAPFIAPTSHWTGSRQATGFLSIFSFSVTTPHSQHVFSFLFAPRDLVELKNLGCILGLALAQRELALERVVGK